MALWLKQSTVVVVAFGPALDKTDGVTLETGLATAMDNATTGIRLSKNGAVKVDRNSSTAPAYDAMGDYRVTLDATDTNTLGTLRLIFEEAATCLPIWQDFMVVPANVWDSFFGADALDVNVAQWLGTAAATPTVAGVPEVDVTHMAGGTQTVTDLKDFADAGYDPVTNKVQGVVLVDTTTTNTDMLTAAAVNAEIDTALADVNLDHLVGTATGIPAIPAGTYLDQIMDDGTAAFDRTTDSLQAIRDRGDSSWVTGAGGTGLTALDSGTLRAGGTSTQALLPTAKTFADNILNGNTINLLTGTGAGQSRIITSNTSADDTANVYPAWTTNPDATTTYEIVQGSINVAAVSLDGAAADNLELDYDGTGYAKANSTIGTCTTNTDMRGTDSAGTAAELAKVPKSDGTASWNATALAAINAEADTAISDAALATAAELAKVPKSDGTSSWNATALAALQSEANDALVALGLDHLVGAAVIGTDVVDNSIVAKLAASGATADWDTFVNTTDSLQAVRDHIGDGTNLTEAGGTGDHLTAIDLPNQTMDITGNITGNLSGSVGSVTGAVGSVTGAVGSVAGNVDGNVTGSVGSNLELGPAEVNAEVVDALNTDTYAEPGQGVPGATISLAAKIGYLFKAWRNRSNQTATTYQLFNDDAVTVDQKLTVSDDATTAEKGEVQSGP